jgi:uncharacterized protein YdeI (YjbR/CyaY-like superfamily)
MDEILSFRSSSDFRKWLAANHRKSDGIWLRIFKKDSGEVSITYGEALDEALCFGWIDGQKQRHDDNSWLQRFTRRRPKSGWSRINTQHAQRLIQADRMKPAGQAEIDAAKKDGRWTAAMIPPATQLFPKIFWLPCTGTGKRKPFSRLSTKRTVTRLPTACKPQRNRRRSESAWK